MREIEEVPKRILVGTAGWSISRASAYRFTGDGSHLQRYARVLGCAEINSSFHRSHAAATYGKWAMSTPPHFRFAIKIPRTITHETLPAVLHSRTRVNYTISSIAPQGDKLAFKSNCFMPELAGPFSCNTQRTPTPTS